MRTAISPPFKAGINGTIFYKSLTVNNLQITVPLISIPPDKKKPQKRSFGANLFIFDS